ncbi:MAG: hypothetical protein MK213_05270 [Planctomycetes bacterium]|nr:hypothetical protein [Planctomycetota bacterium]
MSLRIGLFSLLCTGAWAWAWGSLGQDPEIARLQRLLSDPKTESSDWRVDVWRELLPLEHHSSDLVVQGWRILAESGWPNDRSNLLLFLRRRGLLTEWANPLESSPVAMEYGLFLWGEGRFEECSAFHRQAIEAFPEESRLQDNLNWLEFRDREESAEVPSTRDLALTILTKKAQLR